MSTAVSDTQPWVRRVPAPLFVAVYGALVTGSTPLEALRRVEAVLPSANPRRSFVRELERMSLPLS